MMHPLEQAVPDVEFFLALEPEELAAKLLFLMRQSPEAFGGSNGKFHPINLVLSLGTGSFGNSIYSGQRAGEVEQAVREAIAWLKSQALLVDTGDNNWMVLSRRALRFQDEREFMGFRVARLLPKESLHPALGERVWLDFLRGDYDSAVFKSTKAVEVALREAANADASDTAVQVARKAFAIGSGPLTDPGDPRGEQQAIGDLFAGAFGALKNPHSHRDVNLDDPHEAGAVIQFASYLLRIIEARVHRLPSRKM